MPCESSAGTPRRHTPVPSTRSSITNSELNPDRLDRFVEAQSATYEDALAQLQRGRKTGHWMWFVFPQIAGLGRSTTAQHYAIADADEAARYLAHPVLGPRLAECTRAMLTHTAISADTILGDIDAMKLRSSMTLFEAVGDRPELFAQALEQFYGGRRDDLTLQLLGHP